MAKILVVSDIHYERGFHKGVDESAAWNWLLRIVDYHGPDLLIGLGDWGTAVGEEEFYALLRRVRVWALYGNHDRLEVLGKMYNVLSDKYEPVLFGDGEVREYGGLRFAAINGIVALRRKMKRGVPRKTPDEYVELAERLRGRVDVLLLHESPRLPLPEYERVRWGPNQEAVSAAVRVAGARLVLSGHLHLDKPFSAHRCGPSLCVRVDSSQKSRGYAILDPETGTITLWVGWEEKTRLRF